ncbi:MAG: glycoside hydrolase family 66 protein [Lachnospiraceae bacterium]|nr:glycoside hydrolase family 66 protein [Lachnospiraceae bacterium]
MFEFSFTKAQYLQGEDVVMRCRGNCENIDVKLFKLADEIEADSIIEKESVIIRGLDAGNYGILISQNGETWEGAFDVVTDARTIVRYGFLSDFSAADAGTDDVEWMKDHHINAVQFYDWMYRHDDLISEDDEYEDPLGRKMSLPVILEKVNACKAAGIRPFAYGAVYAATKDTFSKHPEWGMYTLDKEPMVFADWLHFMNISPESGWTKHILDEYRKAIEFGFEGIHMDTYGFPKQVWDSQGKRIELEEEFPKLIRTAADIVKEADNKAGVIFNAVNNWPVESVAGEDQDSVYIEVWPPNDTYYDLYLLIREAKLLSKKNVILAAYLKPFLEENIKKAMSSWRLAWAVIGAAGGTQLVLGENRGILRDSYYVNYAVADERYDKTVRNYCDFLVRYADLLYNDQGKDITRTASGGINEDICFDAGHVRVSDNAESQTVWAIIRNSESRISVNLINLTGNSSDWNKPKNEPVEVSDIEITFRLDSEIKGIYVSSPDKESIAPIVLEYSCEKTGQGRIYRAKIDQISYWSVIWIEKE